jgi:cholesterol oxidase
VAQPHPPTHLVERALGLPATPVDTYTGVWEHVAADGIDVVVGAAVGGGSIAYNAITVAPTRDDFVRAFGELVDYDEMAAHYYPRALAGLGAEPIPEDLLASEAFLSTRVQHDAASKAGLEIRPVALNVDWDIVREELRGDRAAWSCRSRPRRARRPSAGCRP